MDVDFVKYLSGKSSKLLKVKHHDIQIRNLEDLDYISTVEPYEIEIPNLTYREASYLNQVLNIQDKESDLVQKGIISSEDVSKYKKIYRFIPNFYDVRM